MVDGRSSARSAYCVGQRDLDCVLEQSGRRSGNGPRASGAFAGNHALIDLQNWTETYLQWSPRGTYLTTIHKQGVALWGGESWERIVRFVHNSVRLIEFSPCESYLITLSSDSAKDDVITIVVNSSSSDCRICAFGTFARASCLDRLPLPTLAVPTVPFSNGRLRANTWRAQPRMPFPSINSRP